jgi:hypothetical protein
MRSPRYDDTVATSGRTVTPLGPSGAVHACKERNNPVKYLAADEAEPNCMTMAWARAPFVER